MAKSKKWIRAKKIKTFRAKNLDHQRYSLLPELGTPLPN